MRWSTLWFAFAFCLLATACGTNPDGVRNPSMSTEQTAQRENQIRSKPSLEAARAQYEGAMRQMADSIIALVPGLTWNFEENSWNGCGSEYPHIRAKQVYQLIVFSGPIPDAKWPQALQIVKDGVAPFGATQFGVFHDQTGFHDIYLAGPDGIEFRFGTQKASTLSAKSDCRISETDTPSPPSSTSP
ncbi:LppA family lipoprotein [Mycobacterium xenopi]|uniref:Lipoprotein LppV n=1 Tax=Mycobacterium xenopi TaxID=1789 RepID=A0AAD1GYQ2_MYCXE|nr:LppA family lipoprotein [Mycobacterium xenopi]MDA3640896.1 LppA family lipoprotein [Mycobacterium xenopi]MDA3659085.1 LppA family lipoprotein [Mycobacterium xenopi]MDA3663140.1 LppA family lipoprotein [Mycobacterium xenopi]ORX21202.1 hypothetical protein AWC32_01565 [Mycobacterium xenopi]SPX78486.1 putative lipoprotein LPPV [Mycobacterium xenopi]